MRLKNDIERELGGSVRLRAGAPGALDVYVNGEQVYSKKKSGHLPRADEIISLLRPKIAGGT